jgi:hypothetical protein
MQWSSISLYLAAMKMEQKFSFSLGIAIASLFFYLIYRVSSNSPFLDDVNFIDFVYHLAQANQSLSDFLFRLFMVDNNHMAVVPKLGLSLQYLLFHDINFKRILLISAFQIALIGGWFLWQFKQTKKPFWMALPLLLCWLQPQYYEISNWAMTGIQQSSVILFSLLALECIEKPGTKYFILANLCAALAFYSFGSGVLAFVGIGYFLLINKRYRAIPWLIPTPILLLGTYLFMKQLGSVANTSSIQISHAIPFFLNLLGTMAMLISSHDAQAAWTLGALMLVLTLWGLFNINYQSKIATFLLMLLANALLIVSSRDGLGIYMVSRFATLSPLIAMCLYLLYLPRISSKIGAGILVLALAFWLGSYMQYLPVMYQQKHQSSAEAVNWSRNRTWMYATERFQLYASDVLIPSFEQGIWQSENSLLTEPQFKKCLQAQALSLPIQQEKQMLQVSNFPFETGLERPYYFIFLNGQKAYVKNIEFKPNSKKNMLISRKWLMQVGVANMQNVHMEHGKYQIFLFDATNQRFWKMNQTFTH